MSKSGKLLQAKAMNIDFHVKEVGAETYEVTLRVATLAGLETMLDFLVSQMPRRPDTKTKGSTVKVLPSTLEGAPRHHTKPR